MDPQSGESAKRNLTIAHLLMGLLVLFVVYLLLSNLKAFLFFGAIGVFFYAMKKLQPEWWVRFVTWYASSRPQP